MIPVSLAAIIGVPILAIAMVAYALRGRRTDDPPVCRRCGYDLFGMPADSKRCAECGADVTRRRAVRIGHRQRRGGLLLAGETLLVVCISVGGYRGWRWCRTGEWIQYEPVWLLVREAHFTHVAWRDAALNELTRRVAAGTLPPARESALVDEAMALQADLSRPWIRGWGTLVEAVHDAGRLPEKRWATYVFNGYQPVIVPLRPVYRPCDQLEFELHHDDRVGTMNAPDWFRVALYYPPGSRLTIAGREAEESGFDMSGADLDLAMIPDRPGLYGLCHDYSLGGSATPRIFDVHAHSPWPTYLPDRSIKPIRVRTQVLMVAYSDMDKHPPLPPPRTLQLTGTFKVAPSPAVITDPSLASKIERAVSVEEVRFHRGNVGMDRVWWLDIKLRCSALPVGLAFEVVFRQPDGQEFYEGTPVYIPAGNGGVIPFRTSYYSGPKDYTARTVDIELVPSPTASPVGTRAVWGRSIKFANIPVKGKEGFVVALP